MLSYNTPAQHCSQQMVDLWGKVVDFFTRVLAVYSTLFIQNRLYKYCVIYRGE
jgi:hypothetical protein